MRVNDKEKNHLTMPIDGIRGQDRKGELRKAGSSYYEKSFIEARSAAGLTVDLDLSPIVRDVRRLDPPLPDIEVAIENGSSIFIEQTAVMDQGAHRLSIMVEEVNIRVETTRRSDPHLSRILDNGFFLIRFDRFTEEHLELVIAPEDLAAEVCELGRVQSEEVLLEQADIRRYPLLHSLGACYAFRSNNITGSVLHPLTDHGRLSRLSPAFTERFRSKRAKQQNSPNTCRPPWLVLDVDHHFYLPAAQLESIARQAIAAEKCIGFDAVVVQHSSHKPIVIKE